VQVPTAQAVRDLMDFVRTETQRDSKHKKFCFLAILSVLQVFHARLLLVTGASSHLVLIKSHSSWHMLSASSLFIKALNPKPKRVEFLTLPKP
jgi:hypothetical protein